MKTLPAARRSLHQARVQSAVRVPFRITFRSAAGLLLAASCALFLAGGYATARAQRAASGNAQNGKSLYTDKMCAQCHGASAEGSTIGPKIGPNPPAYADFVNQIRNPIDKMPAFGPDSVSDAQVADIYAFLQSLGGSAAEASPAVVLAPGNADNGKKIFVAYGCFECHGRMAQGAAATGPRLGPHPIAITAVLQELRHPANEMPPYTEKTVSNAEVADIYAFLQSLPDPPKPDSIPLLSK
jgi:mono/diheme cytochrome c family protein